MFINFRDAISGLMGAGICQVAAQNGLKVTMVDLNQDALKKGQNYILSSLKRVAKKLPDASEASQKKFIDGVMANVSLSTDSEAAAAQSDLAIEGMDDDSPHRVVPCSAILLNLL